MPNLCTLIVKIRPDLVRKFLKTLFLLRTHTICTSNESSNNTELKFDIENFFLLKNFGKTGKKKFFSIENFWKKNFETRIFHNIFLQPQFFFRQSILNTKKLIYIEVWYSLVRPAEDGKLPNPARLDSTPPPGCFRVEHHWCPDRGIGIRSSMKIMAPTLLPEPCLPPEGV